MTSNVVNRAIAVADAATWCLALTVLAIIMLSSLHHHHDVNSSSSSSSSSSSGFDDIYMRGPRHGFAGAGRACDEIYVVGEGETLHTISDKCGDPFIVEQNPHIHDPDDVFPGLVIKITPSATNNR